MTFYVQIVIFERVLTVYTLYTRYKKKNIVVQAYFIVWPYPVQYVKIYHFKNTYRFVKLIFLLFFSGSDTIRPKSPFSRRKTTI